MPRSTALLVALLAALAAPALAQHHGEHQGEHRGMASPPPTPWKELNVFHNYLHLSHHGLMMNNDLAPTRNSATAMADAAAAWAASTAPTECPLPAGYAAKLEGFAGKARALADLVAKNATDDELKTALNQLHDEFQDLHRACPPSGHGPRHQR